MSWLTESNRHKHMVGGMLIGILSDTPWCAALAGCGVAGALEYKDKAHGGKWDWIDLGCTVAGTTLGYLIKLGSIHIINNILS